MYVRSCADPYFSVIPALEVGFCLKDCGRGRYVSHCRATVLVRFWLLRASFNLVKCPGQVFPCSKHKPVAAFRATQSYDQRNRIGP